MKASTRKRAASKHSQSYDNRTFTGLNIEPDNSRPTVRRKLAQDHASRREKKAIKKSTEGKNLKDRYRLIRRMLEHALENKIVLNFRMKEFVLKRESSSGVPLANGGPFGALAKTPILLTAKGGPRVLVDLDDVVVFYYFPKFTSKSTQDHIMNKLAPLVHACTPKIDGGCGDRRARRIPRGPSYQVTQQDYTSLDKDSSAGIITTESIDEDNLDPSPPIPWVDLDLDTLEDSDQDGEWQSVEWSDTNSEISDGLIGEEDFQWSNQEVDEIADELSACQAEMKLKPLFRNILQPATMHFAPGWNGIAMENKWPMTVSAHLKKALNERSRKELVEWLESKRLNDLAIAYLIRLIHRPLWESLQKIRNTMIDTIGGATTTILSKGWTSCFPCVAVGLNRQTPVHRDSNGLRGGLDVINVFGSFHEGAFHLQDLNVTAEWQPGCLGALDGYDLAHEVLDWHGSHRVTIISFCRQPIWKKLKIPRDLCRPTLTQITQDLAEARTAAMGPGARSQTV